jgi:hypothetical protein
MPISNEELEELCAKLAALELSDDQRLLLDKVMKIAWDFVGSKGDLDAQFDGCFEPGEAALIMAYPPRDPDGPDRPDGPEHPVRIIA